MSTPGWEKCREKPTCGSPVLTGERTAHRRWHESLLGVESTRVFVRGLSDPLLTCGEEREAAPDQEVEGRDEPG